MAAEIVKQLIEAGVHFGHRASRWNPKMKPFIFGKRNLIHIINVKETLKGILLAKRYLTQVVSQGKDIVIVGTKRQARKTVQTQADRVEMHWVIDRWLGGTLTNFREIRKRVGRLDELEKLEAEGLLDAYSKKEGATLRREMRKITRNLGGIRKMTSMPGAMIVVDQRRELIAIREARKIGIPVICLIDTDSDPDLVDIPIPGNDDAMKSIEVVIKELVDAITLGVQSRAEMAMESSVDDSAPAKRSKRKSTSQKYEGAEAPEAPAKADAAAETETETESPAKPAVEAKVEEADAPKVDSSDAPESPEAATE